MTEITSLTTTNPDPNEIAQVVSGAFDQAYAMLNAAWEAMQAGQADEAQGALVAANGALQVMEEQVSLQAALIAGQNEVIETQAEQIESLIENMESVKSDAYQDGYQEGYDEGAASDPDPCWLQEIIDEEIYDAEHAIERDAEYAADKLRTVGEHDLAGEIEEKVKRAIELKDEAEKLIERGNNIAWQKRQNQLPMVLDSDEDSDDE